MSNDQATNEGIVVVGPMEKSKDPYHISSGIHDVLILEVCKNQRSADSIIDCLTVQQENLMRHNEVNWINFFGMGVCATILILVFFSLCKYLRGSKE